MQAQPVLKQVTARLPQGDFAPIARPDARDVTVARAMLEAFARRGVRVAFGIPGGLISPIFDAIADVPQIRLVTTRHEGMAAYAAMGHAVATGFPALVLTTSGPGITNAITGIAAAFAEQLPMIVIAGDVPIASASRGAIQDSWTNGVDSVAMLRTVTRWSARVDGAAGALGAAEQAVRLSSGIPPGPVFLSLPLDVGGAPTNRRLITRSEMPTPPPPDPAICAEIAQRLRGAKRALLVVGNGARAAAAEIRTLAESLAIPVVTTPHAKGVFPESHCLHLGGIGIGGHSSANAYLEQGADVVLVVGSRLGDYTTNGWTQRIAGTEATFQIDRDPWLIGRNCADSVGLVADASLALGAILAALPPEPRKRLGGSSGIVRVRPESAFSDEAPVKPARVLRALQEAFPDALFTADQGEHCAYALHYLQIDQPEQFRTMVALASMGTGFGLAIGAREALPGRTVVGICGDGGFAMHAGEILTCVESGIDVILAVFNDGRWNMVHHGFSAVFGRKPEGLPSHVADLAAVAEGFGAVGVRIESSEDLAPERLRALAALKRPVLLDIRIDASVPISVGTRSAALRSVVGGAP